MATETTTPAALPCDIYTAKRLIADFAAPVFSRCYAGEITVEQIPGELCRRYLEQVPTADLAAAVHFVNAVLDILGFKSRCYVKGAN